MRAGPRLVSFVLAVSCAVLAAASALAQSAGSAPPGSGPHNRDGVAAPQTRATAPEEVARQFAISYLGFWSLPNVLAMPAMPRFYEPRVEFHGRVMPAEKLFREKLRFVRRWPDRRYAPRSETMQAKCKADVCVVRTAFDFVARNPGAGRRSRGRGMLELHLRLVGSRFLIFRETSRVAGWG